MAAKSTIEWCDATWNIITGCSYVSSGCASCYAARLAATRLKNHPSRKSLVDGKGRWTGEVRFNEEWLYQPLRWRKSRRIFVCAHGDLFHEAVPLAWIDTIMDVIVQSPQHIFQILTKRPERARNYLIDVNCMRAYSFPNIWLGTSVEDQAAADERIPKLLQAPARVRWISAEPLLGPIDLRMLHYDGITDIDALAGKYGLHLSHDCVALDWVVAGGESGPAARPMDPDWARFLRDQCLATEAPFFFKQWGGLTAKSGGRILDGRTWDEMPAGEVS